MEKSKDKIKNYLIETYKNDQLIKGFRLVKGVKGFKVLNKKTSVFNVIVKFDLEYLLYKEPLKTSQICQKIENKIIKFMIDNNIVIPQGYNEYGQKVNLVFVSLSNKYLKTRKKNYER